MPLYADLYLDRIDLKSHVDAESCQVCHVDSLQEFVDRLRAGEFCGGRCPHWPRERVEAFRLAIDADKVLPTIPSLAVPRPVDPGLFDFNGPTAVSPLLVTGNSRLTHEVLLAVMSTMTVPMWMLAVDTDGHTVDMSLVYGTLTPDGIASALLADDRTSRCLTGRVIVPGLAAVLARPVAELLGRGVETGPVCAAELPLFFGSPWEG